MVAVKQKHINSELCRWIKFLNITKLPFLCFMSPNQAGWAVFLKIYYCYAVCCIILPCTFFTLFPIRFFGHTKMKCMNPSLITSFFTLLKSVESFPKHLTDFSFTTQMKWENYLSCVIISKCICWHKLLMLLSNGETSVACIQKVDVNFMQIVDFIVYSNGVVSIRN